MLAVCINVWVWQTAWLHYKQQCSSSSYEEPQHKENPQIAHRQLPYLPVYNAHLCIIRTPILDYT